MHKYHSKNLETERFHSVLQAQTLRREKARGAACATPLYPIIFRLSLLHNNLESFVTQHYDIDTLIEYDILIAVNAYNL